MESAGQSLEQARHTLLQLPIGSGLETDVSDSARRAIAGMQAALDEFVAAYMGCLDTSDAPDTAQIQTDLSRLGHAFSLESGRTYTEEELPPDFGKYGFELSFEVRAAAGPAPRLGITADFSIECGSDAVLWVFEPGNDGWREVLRWESSPYEDVSGAFGSFGYSISPPDSSGQWYVVTKNVAPWCSSTWSAIRYAVLRPVSGTPIPRVLFSGVDSIWWGNEDFGTVQANQEDFEVRFHAWSIDAGVLNREYIRRYSIRGDSLSRIAPIAVSPRDFVDEWISLPWPEAEQWTARESAARLQLFHQNLHEIASNSGFQFESAHLCSGARKLYQIEISPDDKDSFYFLVSNDGPLTMKAASTTPRSGCSGKDLLQSMETK